MLDPKKLRAETEVIAGKLKSRGFTLDVAHFHALENQRKQLQTDLQDMQSKRNAHAKSVGAAKAKGLDISALLSEVDALGHALKVKESEFATVQGDLDTFLAAIPNVPSDTVPVGKSEEDNQIVRTWGEPTQFAFPAKDHVELGALQHLMDFATAAKITKSRFVVLHGPLAKLHRALVQFMLDLHTREHGYEEICVPFIVNADSLFGTGQLPKFAEDQFKLVGEEELYLIPTAEVPVTNLIRDTIIDGPLPLKYVCHSPCFRSEAGSYGKDTRGMIRQHQFEKVELVHIVEADKSYQALEQLMQHAEKVLQLLKLPYRVMALCTADIGFSSAKTYDLEVWLPGQSCYREISSCSNMEDFQARRMSARWRNPATGKPELVHTLNGSALAIGRTLVAVLENYQDANGQVHIPDVLQPYMDGVKII